MSRMLVEKIPVQVTLACTVKVVASEDGGYVGFVQEIPMAVQAESEGELRTVLSKSLLEYIEKESWQAIPQSMIKPYA